MFGGGIEAGFVVSGKRKDWSGVISEETTCSVAFTI
jgi:hypothetical protein